MTVLRVVVLAAIVGLTSATGAVAQSLASDAVEDWQRMKATGELPEGGYAPFWQVPVLEVDGNPIAQTAGIARFCGKLTGLYPRDNDFLAAKVDEVLDAATAITNEIFYDSRGKEGDDKLRARQALTQD